MLTCGRGCLAQRAKETLLSHALMRRHEGGLHPAVQLAPGKGWGKPQSPLAESYKLGRSVLLAIIYPGPTVKSLFLF